MTRLAHRTWLLLLLLGTLPGVVLAQRPAAPDTSWNSPRALELIRTAQERRAAANADSGLNSYRADARIFVYFYLDRPDTGERNLVKTDQLALEVFWQAPDLTKQRIVGWRDRKSLPTNINYHLDHLTVVQENFGDEIRLGDGDEVTGVVHPAAPGAEEVYQFRLADSLTLRLPGALEPVRVYEVQVRPVDLGRPGFIGSVFVEQRAGDIVRMDFTFTESAYIDEYLDYINISLDNGLWRDRFWLPNQQRVEIRRRIPILDIPAGSVIRANARVQNYVFDEPLPLAFFGGSRVVAAPREQREAFPFEQEIHAEVREEGIGPSVELGEIREMARRLASEEALRRTSRLRPALKSASEVVRYNRAEGLMLAAAFGFTPTSDLTLQGRAGWAFGPGHALGAATVTSRAGRTELVARFYGNALRDIETVPVASGAARTLTAFFAGEDYLDPYYATGASALVRRELSPRWSAELEGRAERQRSASLTSDFSVFGDFPPVRPIDETDIYREGRLTLRRSRSPEAARWLDGALTTEVGALDPLVGSPAREAGADPAWVKPGLRAEWGRRWEVSDLRVAGAVGFAFGELPIQELYLVGGRGTAPGYEFRAYGGDRFASMEAVLSRELRAPWLRGRLLASLGWADFGEAGEDAMARAGVPATGGVLPGVGVGVGIAHDIIRLDLVRGVREGGVWEVILEANPGFWDFL